MNSITSFFKNCLGFFAFIFLSSQAFPQIVIDGQFSDWDSVTNVIVDANDATPNIRAIKYTYDDLFIYINIELSEEIDIQDSEDISVLIDADLNAGTGFPTEGIGAELTYYFGQKNGFINISSNFQNIDHEDIGMVVLPTVTSKQFELMFKRDLKSSIGNIRLEEQAGLVVINRKNGGDRVPDNSYINMIFKENKDVVLPPYSLNKRDLSHVRILTYNVLDDGLFDVDRQHHFREIIAGINPDIIAFQEIYNHSSNQVATLVESAIADYSGIWYHAEVLPDIALVSKFPIEGSAKIDGNGLFRLSINGKEVLLYNVHLPCCDRDADRQIEIDRILSTIRDKSQHSQVSFNYASDSPILICGDFNLVGEVAQLKSIITGDIKNEDSFGSDFSPDIDGSVLEYAFVPTTGLPATFSWYNINTSYTPGQLDFIFYSGAAIKLTNGYTLFSPELKTDELIKLGISSPNATTLASDHLPVVGDFSLEVDEDKDGYAYTVDCNDLNASIYPSAPEIPGNGIDEDCDGEDQIQTGLDDLSASLNIYPNPASDILTIDKYGHYRFSIFSFAGMKISEGICTAKIEINALNKGIYILELIDLESNKIGNFKFVKF
jgi:endonuclease/exonuclease/phosphatase family metal-dependent hydrolase